MTFDVVSGLRLRLVDLNTLPWDVDVNENFRLIGGWYDSTNSASLLGFKNAIMNGSFDVWQRGTNFSIPHGSAIYMADRWRSFVDGSGSVGTFSKQPATHTALLNFGCRYYAKYDVTVAGTGETSRQLIQNIESVATYSGNTVTLSFVAWGTVGQIVSIFFSQNFGTGGSPSSIVNIATQDITLTAVPTVYTLQFDLPSIELRTLGTNDDDRLILAMQLPTNTIMNFNLGRVCLEVGTQATGFPQISQAQQLADCQRFYESSFNSGITTFTADTGVGDLTSHPTAVYARTIRFATAKRAAPTITLFDAAGGINLVSYNTGSWANGGSTSSVTPKKKHFKVRHSIASSVLTEFGWTADAEY